MSNVFEASRALFEKYAAFDGDSNEIRKAGHPLHATQVELARWHVRNFGAIQAHEMALGICEEICFELNVSYIHGDCIKQNDAIGDALVFATQLLTVFRLSVEPIFRLSVHPTLYRPIGEEPRYNHYDVHAGRIAQHILKRGRMIHKFGAMPDEEFRTLIFTDVRELFYHLPLFRVSKFDSVAKEVLARDWRANPLKGKVECEAPRLKPRGAK